MILMLPRLSTRVSPVSMILTSALTTAGAVMMVTCAQAAAAPQARQTTRSHFLMPYPQKLSTSMNPLPPAPPAALALAVHEPPLTQTDPPPPPPPPLVPAPPAPGVPVCPTWPPPPPPPQPG